jgi:predicted DNA-binding protein
MHMLRRTTIFLHDEEMKQLDALGKRQGLKSAQMVRLAIHEYLRRAAKATKAAGK